MKKEIKGLVVYFIGGIIAGTISFFSGRRLYALIGMIAVFIALTGMLNKLGKEKPDFWIKSGGFIYFFLWVISWTILYNL